MITRHQSLNLMQCWSCDNVANYRFKRFVWNNAYICGIMPALE